MPAGSAARLQQQRSWLLGQTRTFKRIVLMANDVVLLGLAAWASFSIRLTTLYTPPNLSLLLILLSAPIAGVGVFHFFGLYRLVTRFLGHRGAARIFGGMALAALVWAVIILMFVGTGNPDIWVPRSVVFIYPLIGGVLVWASREVAAWLLAGATTGERQAPEKTRVAIFGAGRDGVALLEALHRTGDHEVLGFLDDTPSLIGQQIAGLKVYRIDKLKRLIERDAVKEVLLALPHRQRRDRQAIIRTLAAHPVRVKTMPALEDIAAGRVAVTDLKPIDVDDLLAREPVPPNADLLARSIKGKAVMVTGAGGSIGSELTRQVLRHEPRLVVLFEMSEAALYELETELKDILANLEQAAVIEGKPPAALPRIEAVLGSVLDSELIERTLSTHKIETIYHAAAYKHVPIVEANPVAGLHNNTFGTLSLARAAARVGVERVVLISTDKAVRPTNIMGASKRLAELIFQAAATQGGSTVFTMVRFGNVLDSSGSVVRRFRKQIQAGGPVTVTHRDVIRYFMSIPEAATLVIQAGAMAEGGEVFVLDMGEPVRIDDLARTMIRLMGLEVRDEANPLGDIVIRYVGLRPGEKLYEELLIDEKRTQPTEHPCIRRSNEPHMPTTSLERVLVKLRSAMQSGSVVAIQGVLKETVEGYMPSEREPHDADASAAWVPANRTIH
ncbi:MAG: nucleoside-diphosphate sugar epimerase/dehydratase [Hyphomicrobiaceae bacterium]